MDLNLQKFLLLLGSFSPLLLYTAKQFNDQKEASKSKKELVRYALAIWTNDFFKGEQTLTGYSRQLQNDIYDARTNNPAILDFFYNRLKDEQENTMNRTAEDLVEEAHIKLRTLNRSN
jgi:hypothetical protein